MNEMITRGRRVLIGAAVAAFAVSAVGGTTASIVSAGHGSSSHTSTVVVAKGNWGS